MPFMPLFQPAANPAPNPAGFAAAAASVYDTVQQVKAAAQRQQQQLVQQDLKDRLKTELEMRKAGFTPYYQGTGQTSSGLKTREPQQVDPSRIQHTPWGPWVAPAPKPEATAQQTFTDTTNLLEKGARPVDAGGNVDQMRQVPRYSMDEQGGLADSGMFGIHAAPPAGTTVTPAGSPQAYFVPDQEEKAGLKSRLDAAAAEAKPGTPHVDTEHFSSPVIIDPKGGKATPIQLPDGVTHNSKPEKPDTVSIVPGLTGPKGGLVTFDRTTQTTSEVPIPQGARRELTPAQVEAKARADQARQAREEAKAEARETRFQGQRDAIQKQLDILDTREQRGHDLRVAYGTVLSTPNGEKFVDPETKQASSKPMSDAYRQMYQTRYAEATEAVKTLATQKQRLADRARAIGQSGGGQPAPAPPAAEQPKTVTWQQVDAYLAEKQKANPRFTRAMAIREFNQSGYHVTTGGN